MSVLTVIDNKLGGHQNETEKSNQQCTLLLRHLKNNVESINEKLSLLGSNNTFSDDDKNYRSEEDYLGDDQCTSVIRKAVGVYHDGNPKGEGFENVLLIV